MKNFIIGLRKESCLFGTQTIMKTILFQGDSITDAGRDYDNDLSLGDGYPNLVASYLGKKEPGKYSFFNRGISGDRLLHVYTRYREDIVELNPDYMSILIGANDASHCIDYKNCFSGKRHKELYSMLIEDIKDALPNIKIAIIEPFILRGSATEPEWDFFSNSVYTTARVSKEVANEQGAVFIPTQQKLDKLCEKAPASYWLKDGVHPTPAGHEFLKEEWLKAFNL